MSKIDKLPPEVEARLPEIREEWIKVGLCTDPADRKEAEDAMNSVYEVAGFDPPSVKMWVDSPHQGALASFLLSKIEELYPECYNNGKYDMPKVQKWLQGHIDSGFKEVDIEKNRGDIHSQTWKCGYGQHDAGWLSFYSVFKGLVPEVDKLDGLMRVARSSGWFWPYTEVCVLSERPEFVGIEDERLHCEDGPAVRYRDGFSVYAWHGVRIPAWMIEEKEKITVDKIRGENNAEIKRCMIEIMGIDNWIEKSGAKLVHEDECGKLWRSEMDADEPYMTVEVVNSSPEPDGSYKRYFLRVHPELRPIPDLQEGESDYGAAQELTARNAVASTFGMRGEEYLPLIES